jgi:hypothetical protein
VHRKKAKGPQGESDLDKLRQLFRELLSEELARKPTASDNTMDEVTAKSAA